MPKTSAITGATMRLGATARPGGTHGNWPGVERGTSDHPRKPADKKSCAPAGAREFIVLVFARQVRGRCAPSCARRGSAPKRTPIPAIPSSRIYAKRASRRGRAASSARASPSKMRHGFSASVRGAGTHAKSSRPQTRQLYARGKRNPACPAAAFRAASRLCDARGAM